MRLHLLFVTVFALAACHDDNGTPFKPDMGHVIDNPPPSGDCPAPTGPGVEHAGFLSADETWTAADSPHVIKSDLDVRGATLTIEPCALVLVAEGANLVVGETSGAKAALVAKGVVDGNSVRPVVFTSVDQVAFWGSLRVIATGTADLQAVIFDHGGNPGSAQGYGGTLQSRGDDNRKTPIQNIRAVGVLVQNSASFGIALEASGGFTDDSSDVAVTTSGSQGVVSGGVDSHYAAIVEAPAIHTLPSGDYTGNTKDEILVRTPFAVAVDETIPNRGVPYQVVYDFEIHGASGSLTTLTIEPGVTLKLGGPLYTNPGLFLGDGGNPVAQTRLVAAGTADKPIRITSGAPAPAAGDWAGINWQGGPATGNVMSHVTVEYGGGDSTTNGFGCGPGDNDSLVLITNWQPGEAFISNSTFQHSAAGGIVSGWNSDVAGPDLKSGNTFTAIANACDVSVQKNAAGMCPGNDANPDCY